MKKIILLVPTLLLLLTGCGKEESGVINCTSSSRDVVNGYELKTEYKINYTGDYVNSVNTVETVTSENQEILDYLETYVKTTYDALNEEYGGYTYEVTNENGQVSANVTIDYNQMNLEQFVTDQPTLKPYVEEGKMLVDGIMVLYESLGATCE